MRFDGRTPQARCTVLMGARTPQARSHFLCFCERLTKLTAAAGAAAAARHHCELLSSCIMCHNTSLSSAESSKTHSSVKRARCLLVVWYVFATSCWNVLAGQRPRPLKSVRKRMVFSQHRTLSHHLAPRLVWRLAQALGGGGGLMYVGMSVCRAVRSKYGFFPNDFVPAI